MVLDIATGERRSLLENYTAKGIGGPLAWSPDSRVVLLHSTDHKTLYALNIDGTGLTKVYSSEEPLWYSPVYWSSNGSYLFFPGVSVWGVQTGGVWAAVVRKPGEGDEEVQRRVGALKGAPWPIRLQLEVEKFPPPTPTPRPATTLAPTPCPDAGKLIQPSPRLDAKLRPPSLPLPFQAETLELVTEVQLTRWTAGYYRRLADVTVNGQALVPRQERHADANGLVRHTGGYMILDPSQGEGRAVVQQEGLFPHGYFAFFQPDGDKIVYETQSGGRLWVLDPKTLTRSNLENPPRGFLKGWLPGDRVVVVEGDCVGIVGLGRPRQMVQTQEIVLAISPDGRYYLGRPRDPADHRVIVRDLESGESVGEPWKGTVFLEIDNRSWSPDGHLLVYVAEQKPRDDTGDLAVFDLETGEHRLLQEDWRDPRRGGLSAPLAWSPDSKVLLLRSDFNRSLYALNADGTGLTKVHPVPPGYDADHHWSADGGYLLFQRDAGEGKAGIWAAVVRKPGESDQDLQERVRRLEQGPWPITFDP
jgi:hypothetical protein